MKHIWLILALMLTSSFVVWAEEGGRLFRIDPMPIAKTTADVSFRGFSGEELSIPVGFTGKSDKPVNILADLVQTSSSLALTIFKNKVVAKDMAVVKNAIQPLQVKIDLPPVKAPTLFILALKMTTGESDAAAPLGGNILIEVHPPIEEYDEETRNLINTFEDREIRLATFGEENPFQALLEEVKADFEDLGDDVPDDWDEDTLYLGSIDAETASAIFSGRRGRLPERASVVICLTNEPSVFPGVYPLTGAGVRTKIHLPELKNLSDPRTRKIMNDLLSQWLGATQSND